MSLPFSSRLRAIPVAVLFCATAACSSDAPEPEAADPAVTAEATTMPTTMISMPAEGSSFPAGDVHVMMTAENIMIRPAGDTTANSGHHHLFLNTEVPAVGEVIPAGQTGIIHLGMAQTEHMLTALPAGEYVLINVIGDMAHRVIPQVSDTVHFTVTAAH
jgi:hypothetical protein